MTERLAQQLTDPLSGDIVFKISRPGKEDFLLYASRSILEARGSDFLRGKTSEVLVNHKEISKVIVKRVPKLQWHLASKGAPSETFKSSVEKLRPLSCTPSTKEKLEPFLQFGAQSQNQPIFSGFGSPSPPKKSLFGSQQTNHMQTPLSTPPKMEQEHVTESPLVTVQSQRPTISVRHMSQVTLHNLLYYMYTGKVNLHISGSPTPTYTNCPKVTDEFELYRVATKYGLNQLAARCLHYLRSTLTPMNVCKRLFNLWCLDYPALKDSYIDYLIQSFNVVRRREEWNRFVSQVKDEENPENDLHQQLLEEIMSRVGR